MKGLYTALCLLLTGVNSFGQDFIASPANTSMTNVPVGDYVTAEIQFQNNTGTDLTLGWNLLEKITPSGWDYSYCDYIHCWDATYNHATMTVLPAGQNAYIKVNASTTNNSAAYFKFAVFNSNNPIEADTVEFFFNGVLNTKEVIRLNPTLFPNPVSYGESWQLKDLPSNSLVEVYNSLGQKIFRKTLTAEGNIICDEKLARGAYIIKIKADGFNETRKLIIR
jgi:hypothetical protein